MHDTTCPSVAHVLDRIDGGLARVRFPGGRVPAGQLRAVAEAAATYGNGTLEITNRANLQLRGVRPGAAGALAAALESSGASAGPAGDLRRNVLAGPLSGVDPTEVADAGPVVGAIVGRLDADPAFDDLSPKAGVVVDGGGRWHLAGRRDDVVVTATGAGAWLVLDPAHPHGQGPVPACAVPDLVAAALRATLGADQPAAAGRPGGERARRRLVEGPGTGPRPSGGPGAAQAPAVGPLGCGAGRGGRSWVGAMPPLGRLHAATAAAVAGLAEEAGDGLVRLTPWRGVALAGVATDGAAGALAALQAAGLLTDPGDPFTAVVACAGSAGCTSGWTDAPAHAAAIAAGRRAAGAGPIGVHVSACPKRCAQRAAAPVTLVGRPGGRYDVEVEGRPVVTDVSAEAAVAAAVAAGGAGAAR